MLAAEIRRALIPTFPLHWIGSEDKRLWFGDYAEHLRYDTLARLHGVSVQGLRF